ncbi:hypothetical protein EV715DRAFT_210297 [Schizophyllum commune]
MVRYLCRPRFVTPDKPMPSTGLLVYMSFDPPHEGVFADYNTARKSGAPRTPKFDNAAVAQFEWEEHCRTVHGGHETLPPAPSSYFSIEEWVRWRRYANVQPGAKTVPVNETGLFAEYEKMRRRAARRRERERRRQQDAPRHEPTPSPSPPPTPEPVLATDEEDEVNSSFENPDVSAARKLGKAYRTRAPVIETDDDSDAPDLPKSKKATYRSAPSSPVKPSTRSTKKAGASVARSPPSASTRAPSPKKVAASTPIRKAASTRATPFPVGSVSDVLPLAGSSSKRARSTSPRKAPRTSREYPTLPLFIDDTDEEVDPSSSASPMRAFVVKSKGYKARAYDTYAQAREFVQELALIGIRAHVEGAATEEEMNTLLFDA